MFTRAEEGSAVVLEVEGWREALGEECTPRVEVRHPATTDHHP